MGLEIWTVHKIVTSQVINNLGVTSVERLAQLRHSRQVQNKEVGLGSAQEQIRMLP